MYPFYRTALMMIGMFSIIYNGTLLLFSSETEDPFVTDTLFVSFYRGRIAPTC